MIVYYDTSALLTVVMREPGADRAFAAWTAAETVVGSLLLYPEARAGLARARRTGRSGARRAAGAAAILEILLADVEMLPPDRALCWYAGKLAELHGLRGYDAVHLASAIRWRSRVLVTGDVALAAAARAEGLRVVVPA